MRANAPADVHRVYERGFNTSDIETVLTLYDTDAVIVAEPGTAVSGPDRIRETLTELFEIDGQMHIETLAVVEAGETALLRSHWELKGTAADGTPVHLSSHGSEVVRRSIDGGWKFVIDHPWAELPVIAS
jgi:uncharacterized protein (TIGR02246 family)